MGVLGVATDVDGTITDEGARISCRAIEAIRALEDKGIPVILVSGNALCVLLALREYIGCSGAVVAEHGAVIEYQGKLEVLYGRGEADKALGRLRDEWGDKIIESWSNSLRYADLAIKRTIPWASVERVMKDFPGLKAVDSGFAYHIIDKELDKGKGLKTASKLMEIPLEGVVAIGDSITDMEMLKVVGYRVALNNAPDALKSIADYVTSKSYGEGFAEMVKRILDGSLGKS